MAFNLLSGGAITFILIAVFLLVIVMLYRSIFGNKPLGDLLGGASKSFGNMFKGIANIRRSTQRQRNDEQGYAQNRKESAKIVETVGSQLATIEKEQDFNSDRVNTLKKEIETIKEIVLNDLKSTENISKEANHGNPIVNNLKDIIPSQNKIEAKVAFLNERLRRYNLSFPELQMIKTLSEEIKTTSARIVDLEMQETQIDYNLNELTKQRIIVIQQLLNLIDATEELFNQEPPLEHVTQIEENLLKIKAANSALERYSLGTLIENKDKLAENILLELTQIQERSVAQEAINNRAVNFIKEQIARGKATKKDLP